MKDNKNANTQLQDRANDTTTNKNTEDMRSDIMTQQIKQSSRKFGKNAFFKFTLCLAMLITLAACGGSETTSSAAVDESATSTATSEAASTEESAVASETADSTESASTDVAQEKETKRIGVIQFAPHPSLDNCYTGLIEGLKAAGYVEGENLEIEFQNAQGEPANADLIAKNMAAKDYDLVAAIATPAAMSAYSATKEQGTPVVFTAVSDPIEAQLVQSLEKPGTSATGSSDVLPLEKQVEMIRAFLPEATKIGVLYTTSEPNSVSMLEDFRAAAEKNGFEVIEQGITGSSEVGSGAAALASKGVDCFNNFTDNNVVNNLPSELQAAEKAGIPVFGSEIEQVKNGCLASQSIDYVALGEETGAMAAQILDGTATPQTLPVFTVEEASPVYNEAVMNELGLTLPAAYANAEKVTPNN